jgi:3',5'-cyclic-AMP phosphodiesterase
MLKLAQISDLHITDGPPPYGRDTRASLTKILAAIAPIGVDAIIATGDLTQDGRPGEYAALAQALAQAPARVFLMPGNHDAPAALKAAFAHHPYWPESDDLSYVIEDFPLRIVMLDDTWPNEIGGRMTPQRAAWLSETLQAAPARDTLLALHHPPCPTFDPMFDRIGLHDVTLLEPVLTTHRQVRRIACGHYHRASMGECAGLPVVIAPSTGWHYRLALTEGGPHIPPTPEPPGFLLHLYKPGAPLMSTALWT